MQLTTLGTSAATGVVSVVLLGAVLAAIGSGDAKDAGVPPMRAAEAEPVSDTGLNGHANVAAAQRPSDGTELIGTRALDWEPAEWLNADPIRLRDLRGKVVLVRWWTDTCPFCRRSAPALNEFHERYAARGLAVIGMYHAKPIGRAITADEVREAANERGFRFSIAIDRDWSVLRRWWLHGRHRPATSVSFLIDKRGVIRFVHPGPAYHREVWNGDDEPLRDFLELKENVEMLLAQRS